VKLIDYGTNAVSDYDLDPALEHVVFYRCAYLSLLCIKEKALVHFEIDQSKMSKYSCLGIQFGGDALLRVNVKIRSVGLEFAVWGYV